MNPLLILCVGIIAVIGLIVFLRVNAFLALIAAAMLVSLLAPGELSEKISRVAEAFGSVAASIGIVIALAAVIGTCLMESGAADRIVRSFLRVLGEKRAHWALMGGGFVLSVPVFFDTVFYLLVPLARSLYRRTQKKYMLYLMAICAGAGLTHTLVPPTPGPLFIASTFKIDLGLMILMGIAVALPTAIAGLYVCRLVDRWVPVPMRSYAGEEEPKSLKDEELPSLWLSLAPILLPVLLISAHTVANVFADAEIINRMTSNLVTERIVLNEEEGRELAQDLSNADAGAHAESVEQLAQYLLQSRITAGPGEASRLAQNLTAAEIFSRTEDGSRPAQHMADVTAVLGSPNLALLLSAVVAMALLVWKRKMPLKTLSETVEKSLMSGGVIILITAGGGAFGSMLQHAGLRDVIVAFFEQDSSSISLVILLAAFGVASMLKFSQGSSTVAMITASAMFAAMGISSDMLACHLVYLALAIGTGSVVGSWMNDSGFWIVSRMGVLTETETLKSWTIVLASVGVIGFAFILLFSFLFPMA
jgi:H+/gluconate symporter-like permease